MQISEEGSGEAKKASAEPPRTASSRERRPVRLQHSGIGGETGDGEARSFPTDKGHGHDLRYLFANIQVLYNIC